MTAKSALQPAASKPKAPEIQPPSASVPRETRGQNGYKRHRQLVPRLAQSWWWLVLDASGETIALCDSQENADMIVLVLSRILSSRIIMP